MRKIAFLAAVLTFIFAPLTWAADLSGNWTLSMWGAGAEESFPLTIKADGDKLAVAVTHPTFKEMTGTGTLKGKEISFNLKSSAIEIAFSGTVSGNKMEGTRKVVSGGMGAGGGGQGSAPEGAPPSGGEGGGGAPAGAPPSGGQGGAPGGAPPAGNAQAQSNENFVAVKN